MNNQLSPLIRGMRPAMSERGKIKIGIKGNTRTSSGGKEFQPPQKLDHFVVTTLDRDETGNFRRDESIHKIIGDKPTKIKIALLFDDIAKNFQSRLACYSGKTLFCSGDGERAIRHGVAETIECPCERSDPAYEPAKDKCKMNGVLSCIIRNVSGVGGVWKFRTTSYNSIQGITSSLFFIKQITGGPLAGIPLNLVLGPKTTTTPDGKSQTVYIVSIEYEGEIESLRTEGVKQIKTSVHQRKMLMAAEKEFETAIDTEIMDVDATVDEYYPENADGYVPPVEPEVDLGYDNMKVNTETGEVTEPDTRTTPVADVPQEPPTSKTPPPVEKQAPPMHTKTPPPVQTKAPVTPTTTEPEQEDLF